MKRILSLAAACVAIAGCYSDRLTTKFDDMPELHGGEAEDAVMGESGGSEEDDARVRKRLMELEMEEEIGRAHV